MSVREAIKTIETRIKTLTSDLNNDRIDYIQAGIYLTILQDNLRRLQAETVEI